jgi:hypothetical protein
MISAKTEAKWILIECFDSRNKAFRCRLSLKALGVLGSKEIEMSFGLSEY